MVICCIFDPVLLFLASNSFRDGLPGAKTGLFFADLCDDKVFDDLVFRAPLPGSVVKKPNGAADGILVEGAGLVTKCSA